jgi:hypothetical protein
MFKNIEKYLKTHHVIALAGLLVLILAISQFSERKGNEISTFMPALNPGNYSSQTTKTHPSTNSQPASVPVSSNKRGAAVGGGGGGGGGGLAPACGHKQLAPADLLPSTTNNISGTNNVDQSFLSAGSLAGINTVGSSLRNANLQIRSEPPNPQTSVSPWMNTTIEPDLMRIPLEIGCGPQ